MKGYCVSCEGEHSEFKHQRDTPAAPTTHTGKRLFTSIDLPATESAVVTRDDIIAIEAEARRDVVAQIRHLLGPIGPDYDPPWDTIDKVLRLAIAARLTTTDEGAEPACTRARHDEHCADLHWEAGGRSGPVQSREGGS